MNGKRRDRKGFTLIELSIVLIIIGLLLAAIVKGKDLIRSAELKKFYNGFVKQWELLFNNYYDRTGKVLGAPLVVKETSNSTYDSYVGADLTDTNTDLVIRDPRRFKTFDNTAINNNNGYYANTIIAAGLTLPNPVRGYSNMFDITATEVGRASVIVTFGSDPVANGKKLYFYKYATNVAVNGTAENKGGVVEDNVSNTSIDGHGDGRGNFSFGLEEQLVFPEVVYDDILRTHGMNINIATTTNSDKQATKLLELMGLPFTRLATSVSKG